MAVVAKVCFFVGALRDVVEFTPLRRTLAPADEDVSELESDLNSELEDALAVIVSFMLSFEELFTVMDSCLG